MVVDACRDDTVEFLSGYAPPYPLRYAEGPGRHAAAARNIGAALAAGEVLLFSDDDAITSPGWISEHSALHASPGYVGVSKLVLPAHLQHGATLNRVDGWWNASGAAMSVRRELFERAGGYDESFSGYGGEDPELGWRLRRLGARFKLLRRAPVEHWDEEYISSLEAKAHAAGRAHVKVWRKHRDLRIAVALGVHPILLGLKRLLLAPPAARLVGEQTLRYERAYASGASEELRWRTQ